MEEPLPAHQRAAVLDGVADLLRERRDEFARTIAEEAGKPITTATVEADRAFRQSPSRPWRRGSSPARWWGWTVTPPEWARRV